MAIKVVEKREREREKKKKEGGGQQRVNCLGFGVRVVKTVVVQF